MEIVRRILELSAYGDRPTSLTLIQVCKEVQIWITPLLYKTVILQNAIQLAEFARTVETSELGERVRILVVDVSYISINGSTASRRVFWSAFWRATDGCRQLDTLLTRAYTEHPMLTDEAGVWHPHYVMFQGGRPLETENLIPLQAVELSHPLLQNITHLCIFTPDAIYSSGNPEVRALLSITSLTHLALEVPPEERELNEHVKCLLQSVSLRVLLLMTIGPVWTRLGQIMDERLYAGRLPQLDRMMISTSGRTIWDGVETTYKGWRDEVADGEMI